MSDAWLTAAEAAAVEEAIRVTEARDRELDAAIRITNSQVPGPHVTPDTCELCGGLGCPGGCPCDCRDCNPPRRR